MARSRRRSDGCRTWTLHAYHLGETAAWVLQTTTLSARGTHSVIYTDFVDDPKHPLALDVVQEWLDAAQGQVYQGMRKLLELDHEQEVLPLD